MKKKVNKISITQKDGYIKIYRNDELEQGYDMVRYTDKIKTGKVSAVDVANFFAEIINDCLNCKTASSCLTDLNDCRAYYGTYFEDIDGFGW